MKLAFKSRRLKKLCEKTELLQRKYGDVQTKKIIQRLNELYAASSLQDIKRLPQARLHLLRGRFEGNFSVDVKQPYRLIILPLNGDEEDLELVTKIKIIEIIDYH